MDSGELNSSSLSERQTVLRRLWETKGPDEVLSTMKSSQAARDEALVETLIGQVEEISRYNDGAASQLAQIADCIVTVHGLADSLSKVDSLEGVVEWYRLNPHFTFSHGLACVLGAMKTDADRQGNHERSRGLREGLRARRKLGRLARQADSLRGLDGAAILDALDRSPELRSDTFHSWLQLLASKGEREDGARVRALLDALTAVTKTWQSLQREKAAEPGAKGWRYLPPDAAALWYVLLPKDVVDRFVQLTDLVVSGAMSLGEAKERAVEAAAEIAPGPDGRAVITTHLLEFVLHRSGSALAQEVVEMYERAVEEPSLRGHPRGCPKNCVTGKFVVGS